MQDQTSLMMWGITAKLQTKDLDRLLFVFSRSLLVVHGANYTKMLAPLKPFVPHLLEENRFFLDPIQTKVLVAANSAEEIGYLLQCNRLDIVIITKF